MGPTLTAALGIGFGVLFFIAGASRVVEFSGVRLGDTQRRLMIVGHLVGCALFAAAFAVLGLDAKQERKQLIGALLFSGVVLLFPIHIYLGLKRRIVLRDLQEAEDSSTEKKGR